jgi:hypothetical protein
MASPQVQPEIKPTTIFRHAYAIYPPMAMLAGMQLDVFTPLQDGPMTASALADALDMRPEKRRPLLYADAELQARRRSFCQYPGSRCLSSSRASRLHGKRARALFRSVGYRTQNRSVHPRRHTPSKARFRDDVR